MVIEVRCVLGVLQLAVSKVLTWMNVHSTDKVLTSVSAVLPKLVYHPPQCYYQNQVDSSSPSHTV